MSSPIPKDRRKDTAAYASLPSQQCQRAKTQKPQPAPEGAPGLEGPRRPGPKNPAADAEDLPEPLPKVNTCFEDFLSKPAPPPSSIVFGQASSLAEAYSPPRDHHPDQPMPAECFPVSSEEPWNLARYWPPRLVAPIGIPQDPQSRPDPAAGSNDPAPARVARA